MVRYHTIATAKIVPYYRAAPYQRDTGTTSSRWVLKLVQAESEPGHPKTAWAVLMAGALSVQKQVTRQMQYTYIAECSKRMGAACHDMSAQ